MTKNEKKKDFLLKDFYPDSKSLLKIQFKSVDDIKDDCIFVIDTNSLFIPFGYSSENLEEIEEKFQTLIEAKRLFIPGQVIREFVKNRPNQLIKIYNHFSKIRDENYKVKITPSFPTRYFESILGSEDAYNELMEKQKEILKSIGGIRTLLNEYKEKSKDVLKIVEMWNWNDPVSQIYSKLFVEEVVTQIEFKKADLLMDFESRCKFKIPPGFKDAKNTENPAGDFIIWKTILELGKSLKNDVIFISSDAKSDWWHKPDDKKTLYPRYELVYEFYKETNQNFYIIDFYRFLEIIKASDDLLSATKTEMGRKVFSLAFETALVRWFTQKYPIGRIFFEDSESNLSFDILLKGFEVDYDREGNPSGFEYYIGVEIRTLNSISQTGLTLLIRDCLSKFKQIKSSPVYISEGILILIFKSKAEIWNYVETIESILNVFSFDVPITIVSGIIVANKFLEAHETTSGLEAEY